MQIGYSWDRSRLVRIGTRLALVVGLCALPITMHLRKVSASASATKPTIITPLPIAKPDPRTVRLAKYLSKLHCPVANLSEDFIHAADDNGLDWRLLPSIAVIESGGGKAYRNNNIFGWANGETKFPTVRSGINEVAFRLGKSSLYRGKDMLAKLRLYNPDPSYARSVLTVMHRISPVTDLMPAARLVRQQDQFAYESD
jgi:hypothetical protein